MKCQYCDKDCIITEKELIERLAVLEHDQWWEWSRDLSQKEKLSKERTNRWNKLWTFYKFLSETEKEQDRIYARKIVGLLRELGVWKDGGDE